MSRTRSNNEDKEDPFKVKAKHEEDLEEDEGEEASAKSWREFAYWVKYGNLDDDTKVRG